eukprot:gnl/Hemi2/17957_TR5928_c0_g1_i1.p1 gnl/Hemi2/17957_TR5928_c0_g1~~gnl/Hemi2/17957_TR5928_c0_g1_i1.p1  ORF type:complete len:195 (-),score=29.78 gnl/Hemi2/17957_TR5928_c0_g1_i1:308-892(-)
MHRNNMNVAVVCASNMNRSMEAHHLFQKRGLRVRSFGTGTHVKIPGPAPDRPNVYEFGTPFEAIYRDLTRKDFELYTSNGLLHLLDRNQKTKPAPERWQTCSDRFDLVITFEERIFDSVIEDMQNRGSVTGIPVHIVNVETVDNHDDAILGARIALQLVLALLDCHDWQSEISEVIESCEASSQRHLLHTVMIA